MNVFNSAVFRDSALTTYGFPAGHVFAIRDPEEVLYEHVSHDKLVLHARPVANPALSQVFTQEEFRALVEAGRVDPRVEENSLPRRRVAALRLTLCVAIDEATKVVLGVRLAVTASGDVSMRTLEMVCRNKDEIARAAGCRSSWHHACTPMTVATDSGPEFIDAGFRCAVRDVGAANEIGPAKHPDARGVIERFFLTLDAQLMPHFQGRTFSGVDDKGDYKPGDFANVLVETLGGALVRYVVDVYHNSPHAGLGGQTPNDAWEDQSARYEVLPPPPPHRLRTVFGFSDNRRIQNRGVRFLGLFYRSEKLARLRARIGQADVRIRADLENLGAIWVSENVPGAEWIAADCDLPMECLQCGGGELDFGHFADVYTARTGSVDDGMNVFIADDWLSIPVEMALYEDSPAGAAETLGWMARGRRKKGTKR